MKVRYIGNCYPASLQHNKIYDVIEIDPVCGWYRIMDETEEDYLFPPDIFDVLETHTTREITE